MIVRIRDSWLECVIVRWNIVCKHYNEDPLTHLNTLSKVKRQAFYEGCPEKFSINVLSLSTFRHMGTSLSVGKIIKNT